MKRFIKIAFINIFLLLLIICIVEVVAYSIVSFKYKNQIEQMKKTNKVITDNIKFPIVYNPLKTPGFEYSVIKNYFRKPNGLTCPKKPIILFGCSFTFGDGLKENETLSYKLSNLTQRPVYNRAFAGWGVQHMFYQLKRDDFYSEVKEPEYVIYVLMSDHLKRLFRNQMPPPFGGIGLRYKLVNNNFVELKPMLKPLQGLYSVNTFQNLIFDNIIMRKSNESKQSDYFLKMINESSKIIKQHYPKAKFVILIYRDKQKYFIDDNNLIEKLKQDGIIVIDSNELVPYSILNQSKYTICDGFHPSSEAWDLIAPKLIERLNL